MWAKNVKAANVHHEIFIVYNENIIVEIVLSDNCVTCFRVDKLMFMINKEIDNHL